VATYVEENPLRRDWDLTRVSNFGTDPNFQTQTPETVGVPEPERVMPFETQPPAPVVAPPEEKIDPFKGLPEGDLTIEDVPKEGAIDPFKGLPEGDLTIEDAPEPEEKPLIERMGETISHAPGGIVHTVEDVARAARRGWLQGDVAMELQKPQPDLKYVAKQQKLIDSLPASQDYQKTWDDSVPNKESWQAFAKNPVDNLGQLLSESFASMIRTQIGYGEKIPERTIEGAITGGTIGAAAEGVGAIPGTVLGARTGFKVGMAENAMLASHANEYAGSFIQSLQESGVDPRDEGQMRAAFSNPEMMARIRDKAEKKAMPVAVFDGLSAAVGGNFFPHGVKKAGRKAAEWATEMGFQMLMGGGGELVSQLASEGKVTSWKSILAEIAAEPAMGAVEIAAGRANAALDTAKQAVLGRPEVEVPGARTSAQPPPLPPPPIPGAEAEVAPGAVPPTGVPPVTPPTGVAPGVTITPAPGEVPTPADLVAPPPAVTPPAAQPPPIPGAAQPPPIPVPEGHVAVPGVGEGEITLSPDAQNKLNVASRGTPEDLQAFNDTFVDENPHHRALSAEQANVVADQMDKSFAEPAAAQPNLVPEARAQAIDAQLARTTDPVQRQELEKEKILIQTKQTAQAQVAEVKQQAQNLVANNAPETARALVQATAGQIGETAVDVQERLDEITPAGVFAEEEGAAPPAAQPAVPGEAAPPAVPPPAAQVQAVAGVQPAMPGIQPAAEAVAEEEVVRPGIKGQEVVVARPSQQIAQQLAGVKVDVPTISETGEAGVAPAQDAAQALAGIKNDLTGFQILINCLS
jgi:hypothetical protein